MTNDDILEMKMLFWKYTLMKDGDSWDQDVYDKLVTRFLENAGELLNRADGDFSYDLVTFGPATQLPLPQHNLHFVNDASLNHPEFPDG